MIVILSLWINDLANVLCFTFELIFNELIQVRVSCLMKTSSPKGNDRSPESQHVIKIFFFFFLFFFFLFSLTSLSRLFHSYRDEPIRRWGENGSTPGKTTWHTKNILDSSQLKDFFRRSRAANSTDHGLIWSNFELMRDLMVVLVTCKN